MKVLDLLEEIEEIVDTAAGFPLTGKIMVDSTELLEIVKEIRAALPDEIHQAQWVKNEQERILGEAKTEYETVIKEAERRAEELIEKNEIMMRARTRADNLMSDTEENVKNLKLSTYDYIDSILYHFQEKMDAMNVTYFNNMFENLQHTFEDVNSTLATNREEIKEMAYTTEIDGADIKVETRKTQD
ncbi:MAG: hypothetical protein ACRCUS_06365 [Anaerovoracaceae bacterium]